ncbi:MAG: NUDIX domain-containing protein [bacterium]|nr:NUDIX domain-containing protein [bacterium]
MKTAPDLPPGVSRTVAFQNRFLRVEIDDATRHSVVRVTDAAAVLIYVRDRNEVLLISQRRAASVSAGNPSGRTEEAVAGRFDYQADVRTLLANEALEEAGVVCTPEEIVLLNGGQPLYSSPGVLTERVHLAYVEVDSTRVDPDDRVYGAAGEHEAIRRRFVPADELAAMHCDNLTAMTLIQWFLNHRRERRCP